MNNFIPEKEYKKIIQTFPIFCIDFLVSHDEKYLLIKRIDEPLSGVFWVIGGRLRFKESIQSFSKRIQYKEIGRFYPNIRLKGFSNYIFKYNKNSRAIHTPTLLYKVIADEIFEPKLDNNHTNYCWSEELPIFLKENILFF